jgi:CheY-like chemotaxis protein
MAELHGGSVQVESTPGQGSRFTLVLPWEDRHIQPVLLKRLHSSEKLRALTIDPQVIDTDSVTRYLHSLNIENKVRTNTELIVEYAAVARPDLILLELNLPTRSGLEVLAELKADERTRAIAVIIMSVEEKRGKSMALGAAGYLVKPFSLADLTNELERVFSMTIPRQTEPLISTQGALILVADDNEENLQMLEDFLKSRNFSIEKARNGLEMLALAAQTHPAMILVDIQMPEMDGLEAIRRIRAHQDAKLAATPIIAITALAMPGDRDNCLSAGANEYLSKPLELGKLVEGINILLN